jgi:periplasmic protein TonB
MTGSPKQSALYSVLIHAGAIAVVLLATTGRNPPLRALLPNSFRDLKVYLPPVHGSGRGGGGGGMREPTPASRGNAPRPARRMFVKPTVTLINLAPRLPMEQTLLVNTPPPAISSPQIGDPLGVIGPLSAGPGDLGGIGDGRGHGIGSENDDGYGPGPGGPDRGDSRFVKGPRGVFTSPSVLWKTEPPYTEEARRAKLQGTVVLLIEINTHGQAQNIRLVRSLGLGLDERAVETVGTWKFRPAYRDGKAVTTTATVELNFRLL